MRTTTTSETKASLSALPDHVKAGESILITDPGVPMASTIASLMRRRARAFG